MNSSVFLEKIIRNMLLLTTPVLDASYELQKTMGDVNLIQVTTSGYGAW